MQEEVKQSPSQYAHPNNWDGPEISPAGFSYVIGGKHVDSDRPAA